MIQGPEQELKERNRTRTRTTTGYQLVTSKSRSKKRNNIKKIERAQHEQAHDLGKEQE